MDRQRAVIYRGG